MELLTKYFPLEQFNIKDIFKPPVNKKNISGNIEEYEITEKNKLTNCITFSVFINKTINKGIYVTMLDKCGEFNGGRLLNILEEYAKERGDIIQIDLEDSSNLYICENYVISLYILQILTTGTSWYNKLGYKSYNYDNEVKNNMIQIEKNFVNVFYQLLQQADLESRDLYNSINSILEMINIELSSININEIVELTFTNISISINNIILDIDPDILDKKDINIEDDPFNLIQIFTIQEIFNYIKQYLQKYSSNCEANETINLNLSIISFLIMFFKKFHITEYTDEEGFYILYENMLSKQIAKTGGKKYKKTSKKRRKNKKTNKNKTNKNK